MMNIKPSFARKLNQDGLSPIHVALKNEQTKLVLRLLETDKDLARVKGREGVTPLRLVITTGKTRLLFELLEACPECIEDVTVNGDTALHLALKSDQTEAFDLLVGWLQINSHESALRWETKIVNWRDNEDNTALHIAAKRQQHQALKRLLNSHLKVDINIKDSEGLTALGIIEPEKAKRKLKKGSCKKETKYSQCLKPHLNILRRRSVEFDRLKKNMSLDLLNAMLVVAVLVLTATYQSSVSPPGGVIQADGSSSTSNNVTHMVHSGNSSDFFQNKSDVKPKSPGTVVMDLEDYSRYWIINSVTFWYTIGLTAWLLSSNGLFCLLLSPLSCLGFCYHYSMSILSPSANWSTINTIMEIFMAFSPLLLLYSTCREIQDVRRDIAYFLKRLNRRATRQEGSNNF